MAFEAETGWTLQVQGLIILCWHQAIEKKDIILSLVVCFNTELTPSAPVDCG